MDAEQMSVEFFEKMRRLRRAHPQKFIDGAMHGVMFILDCIAQSDGDVQPGEIGQETGVTTARVATALNNLEKKNLIVRRVDPEDRRKVLVTATESGKELASAHRQSVLSVAAKMLEFLGERDAEEYLRITGRLAELLPDIENDIMGGIPSC